MAMVINSNIMSLNAQRNLTISQGDQNQAMERLTSGKRINSAGDDAAGLAIANRMTSQINGLNAAVRNANDGVSLIQTAEGALDETSNILQRMRELSIQSANGTYDDGNRSTLNAEVQQLVKELDRISETTSFNGQKILDGTQGEVSLQVGSEANETIEFEITAMNSKTLGLGSTSVDVAGDNITALSGVSFSDGDIQINGQSIGDFDGSTDDLEDLLSQINTNVNGVTASAFNNITSEDVGTGNLGSNTLTFTSTDPDGSTNSFTVTNTNDLTALVDAINTKSSGSIAASLNDDGKLVLENNDGGTITVADTAAGVLQAATGITVAGTATSITNQGQLAFASDDGSAVTISKGVDGTAADLANLGLQDNREGGVTVGTAITANTALTFGDLKINGTTIEHADSTTLQQKVDNINAATSDTGVTASLVAEADGDFKASNTYAEVTFTAAAVANAATATATLNINGITMTFATGASVASMVGTINTVTSTTGVTARVDDSGILHLSGEGNITLAVVATLGGVALEASLGGAATALIGDTLAAPATELASALTGGTSLRLNNTEVTLTGAALDDVITSINSQSLTTGVSAGVNDNGELLLSSNSSFQIAAGDVDGTKTLENLGLTAGTINSSIELDSVNDNTISVETTTAGAAATGLKTQNEETSGAGFGSSINSIDISSAAGAQKAIGIIDNALESVSDSRSELGAINNRLDFTVNNLSNVSENASAARSRIEDADFAAESAALSRAQVLQQAGTAMLAQANAAPQQVLSLLQ